MKKVTRKWSERGKSDFLNKTVKAGCLHDTERISIQIFLYLSKYIMITSSIKWNSFCWAYEVRIQTRFTESCWRCLTGTTSLHGRIVRGKCTGLTRIAKHLGSTFKDFSTTLLVGIWTNSCQTSCYWMYYHLFGIVVSKPLLKTE